MLLHLKTLHVFLRVTIRVDCLHKECKFNSSTLNIFLNLFPLLLVIIVLFPSAVILLGQGMVHLAYNSDTTLFLLFLLFILLVLIEVKLGLGYQLFLVDVVIIMTKSQRVIPLSSVQWQVIQKNAPDERPQSLDLVCDPMECQTFKLTAIYLLAWLC